MIFRGKSDSGDVSFFQWYLFSIWTLRRSKGKKSEEEGKGGKTKKQHLYPHNFCLILIFKKKNNSLRQDVEKNCFRGKYILLPTFLIFFNCVRFISFCRVVHLTRVSLPWQTPRSWGWSWHSTSASSPAWTNYIS